MRYQFATKVKIGPETIGDGRPVFVIAEAGSNHNGSLKIAKALIDAASDAGADAVKFQTFHAEDLVSKNTVLAKYMKDAVGLNTSQFELLKKLELSEKDHISLKEYAKKRKIIFLSTPFDKKSAGLLFRLGVPAFKVGSGDTDNIPLVKYEAKFGLPMIISTGMCDMRQIDEAADTVYKAGNKKLVLMHCVSSYPANIEDINLNVIFALKKRFRVPVGFSDHSLGLTMSVAAAALGANVIEKHITLSKDLPGPDHSMSMAQKDFAELVKMIREVEKGLGSRLKNIRDSERDIIKVCRKSIVAASDIPKGFVIREQDICVKRPSGGIAPRFFEKVIGKKAKRDIKEEEPIKWSMML